MSARLGVCSWSLPIVDVPTSMSLIRQTGVGGIELALDPIRKGLVGLPELRDGLAGSRITILSAMMVLGTSDVLVDLGGGALVPDTVWSETLKAAEANARVAFDLGLQLVSLRTTPRPAPEGKVCTDSLVERIRRVAAPFTGRGITVALEVGRADADTTIGLLIDLNMPEIGVSFDPAELVLHRTGDPVEALDLLSSYVRQIRIRDATPPEADGARGTEVAAGDGAVDWGALFDIVRDGGLAVPMMIARETGDARLRDIKAAAALVRAYGMEE